jgi:hypothetical protein
MAILSGHFSTGLRTVRRALGPIAFALLLLAALAGAPGVRAAEPSVEYKVKATFLFNFAQFVEWPPSVYAKPDSPLVIGIVGNDPFGPFLDSVVANEKICGRAIAVRRFKHWDEVTDCEILFVSVPQATEETKLLERLKGHSVLTVGDSESFNRSGGMIRFVLDKGKIRMRINMDSATTANLRISSKILRWATIVPGGND